MGSYVRVEDVIAMLEHKRLTIGKVDLAVEYACADIQEKVEKLPTVNLSKIRQEIRSHNNTEKVSTEKLHNGKHTYYRAISVTKALKILDAGGIKDE